MPILGTDALAVASHDAAILAHCAQDGVCIVTQEAMQALYPGDPGSIHDLIIEGTPIRLALPNAIAGRTVQ